MEPDLLAVTRQCVERGQRSAVCVVSWRVSAACLVLYELAGIHEESLAPEKGGSGESKVRSYMHCETARPRVCDSAWFYGPPDAAELMPCNDNDDSQ